MNTRTSGLKREFKAVKQESSYDTEDHWIESRLDDDSNDLEDIILKNRK